MTRKMTRKMTRTGRFCMLLLFS